MTPEQFLAKFDLLAGTPNAVQAMREMVLAVAFSGGLSGELRVSAGLPTGWRSETIDAISDSIVPGFACSKSNQVEGGHVHLRTHNVSTLGTLNFDLLVRIDPAMVDPKKSSLCKGDILFNNTNSQELVGKSALVDQDYDYAFSNHITRLRLSDGVLPAYVTYFLNYLRNSGHFARLCTRWINQAAINTDRLREQCIPLPSLAEQKRIVAKVDELMALCDRLEAQQQEREHAHAALTHAALARFVDAPTAENLEFLFHKSCAVDGAALRDAIRSAAVSGAFGGMSDQEAQRPLKSLTSKIGSGATPRGGRESYVTSGTPLIRSMNVHFGGFSPEGLVYLTDDQAAALSSATVQTDDVLLNITGASIGRVTTAPDSMAGARVNQHVTIIRPLPDLVPAFLSLYLASVPL